MQETAGELIDMVQSGKVKIPVNQRYALADVVQAHRDLSRPQDNRNDGAHSMKQFRPKAQHTDEPMQSLAQSACR